MRYYVHDPEGRVLMSGECPVSDFALQRSSIGAISPGEAFPGTHYHTDGGPVALPPKPSSSHVFDYSIKAWALDVDLAWAEVRAKRNRLLAESDWTQLPDVAAAVAQAWAPYRQELRDVTLQANPLNIQWPTAP